MTVKLEQLTESLHSEKELSSFKGEELQQLKQHIQTFSIENTSLKKLVQAFESQGADYEKMEEENNSLLN